MPSLFLHYLVSKMQGSPYAYVHTRLRADNLELTPTPMIMKWRVSALRQKRMRNSAYVRFIWYGGREGSPARSGMYYWATGHHSEAMTLVPRPLPPPRRGKFLARANHPNGKSFFWCAQRCLYIGIAFTWFKKKEICANRTFLAFYRLFRILLAKSHQIKRDVPEKHTSVFP